MKILLDTHILLWAITEDSKLPIKAEEFITSPENETFYSSISIWEVAIKRSKHPNGIVNLSPQELVNLCKASGISALPLEVEHVYALETLSRSEDAPQHHDPFDRILLAQAKAEGMNFLTHDELMRGYNEPCIIFS